MPFFAMGNRPAGVVAKTKKHAIPNLEEKKNRVFRDDDWTSLNGALAVDSQPNLPLT